MKLFGKAAPVPTEGLTVSGSFFGREDRKAEDSPENHIDLCAEGARRQLPLNLSGKRTETLKYRRGALFCGREAVLMGRTAFFGVFFV